MQTFPYLAESFGRVLFEARKAVPGLSQEKLAEAAGLERAYISRLERGRALPTLTVLFLLAPRLELSVADLMERVEQRVALAASVATSFPNQSSL